MKTATLRGTAVTARVGLWLGVVVAVCFVTGLISHFIQHPQPWFFWPTRPVWLYRVTQGLHVISGIAAIPLIIVKLWSVWPKLFERPIIGGPVRQIERLSILVLVGSMLFQLSTGLLNIAQWYAFKFFFTTSHYAMAYVAAGAVLVHIGVKLPVIRSALGEPVDDTPRLRRADATHGAARDMACGGARHGRHGGADGSAAAQGVGAGAAFRARAARRSGEPVGDRRRRAAQRAVTRLPVDGDERVDDAGVHRSPNSRRCRRRRTGCRSRVSRGGAPTPSGPGWCWPTSSPPSAARATRTCG